MKVKVVELSTVKLDPGAKYIFVIDRRGMTLAEMRYLWAEIRDVFDTQVVIAPIRDVNSIKVLEILPEDQS